MLEAVATCWPTAAIFSLPSATLIRAGRQILGLLGEIGGLRLQGVEAGAQLAGAGGEVGGALRGLADPGGELGRAGGELLSARC